METANWVYTVCLVIGLLYLLVTLVLGHLHFGVDHGAVDHAGIEHAAGLEHQTDLGGGHGDVHGVEHAGAGAAGYVPHAVGWTNPMIIAIGLTFYGGLGLYLGQGLHLPPVLSVPISLGSGVLLGLGTAVLLTKLMRALEKPMDLSAASLVGGEAQVITPIAADGVGEIAFSLRGVRRNAPARAEDNAAIAKHAMVRITRLVGGVFYVRESTEERLRKL